MADNISNSSSNNIEEFFDPTETLYINLENNNLSDEDKTISNISIKDLKTFYMKGISEMSAEEYLKHIFKICIVHYNRNIKKLKDVSKEIKNIMRAISTYKIKNKVEKAFKLIEYCKSKVAEVISPAYTKMNLEIWNTNRNNTNIIESVHYSINIDGTYLFLLAIIKTEEFDYKKWNITLNFTKYNISTSGINKLQVNRYKEAAKEERALELLKQKVALERELSELRRQNNDI
ncbi:6244_t:CDS:2 [Funneliformis mosseae]|uniref:6244_t:CDS:1 n=1 Tax=Funneliformis mosseae TaxID=27381 RepID=A0A9N8ZBV7_FUNMO|nr:6244_t:CDS:2 [Funneliformis mosseae]